jgi:hypothetical protein
VEAVLCLSAAADQISNYSDVRTCDKKRHETRGNRLVPTTSNFPSRREHIRRSSFQILIIIGLWADNCGMVGGSGGRLSINLLRRYKMALLGLLWRGGAARLLKLAPDLLFLLLRSGFLGSKFQSQGSRGVAFRYP